MKIPFEEKHFDKLPIVGPQPKDAKEEKWLREVINIEFQNREEPGLMQKFPYGDTRCNMTLQLMHGGNYRLPRHVVRHIESRETPRWEYRPDGSGSMQKQMTGTTGRFQCRQVFG
jgi:hypothetical protein